MGTGIVQLLTEFFESIFNRNSPEVQQKIKMKKLETELRSYQPFIFKNGNLLPNFAEAIRLLYVNTKPLNDLLSTTIACTDIQRAHRFEAQLVLTGFSMESQKYISELSYDARKQELIESSMTTSQIYDRQRKKLDKITAELGTSPFRKIDSTLTQLHQLSDFCRFNFVTILQVFDSNFISADLNYQPVYNDIGIERLSSALEDLYFQMKGMVLTNAVVNAIFALAQLKTNGNITNREKDALASNIKSIAYVLNHVLSPEKLKSLICYAKSNLDYIPGAVSYKESASHNFEQMIKARFKADEQRIKTELKDENIRSELSQLFGQSQQLLVLQGYNQELSQKLLSGSSNSFLWILPMQILKTFLTVYLTEPIRSLLNDIVIEGFFNNPNYKSEFSSTVFAALESNQTLEDFENSFSVRGKNSTETLESYLRDGHNDPDFLKKLDLSVQEINAEASKIIAKETNNLNSLYKHIVDLIADAKKPTSEIISNLKVLMMSSRNRDNTDLLEQQYGKWEIFFKIMKNYAIITG